MVKNYKEFDYQTIVVKTEKKEQLIDNYSSFGWTKIEEKPHKQFDNLVEITFSRPHIIENKDELQFLQVNLEYEVNREAKLIKNKHSKSLIFALSMMVLISMLIVFAIFSMIKLPMPLSIILCCIYSVFAVLFFALSWIILKKLLKKENVSFETNLKSCIDSVHKICERANVLTKGDHNGKTSN